MMHLFQTPRGHHWPLALNCRCALTPNDTNEPLNEDKGGALKICFEVAVQAGASEERINSILDEYNQLGQTAHITH
jgi:hypothetical protein